MLGLVKNLQAALGQHIAALDWMSDATKAKAQEKLAAFTVKIGYPDKWKDYSTLAIDPRRAIGGEHRQCQPLGRQYLGTRQACR